MAVNPALLMLADSRLPAGGHAHSGGLEPAAAAGRVTGLAELDSFLRGRLATAGVASAALAAAACAHAAAVTGGARPRWAALSAEAAARTASPAARRAACAQGRALLRAGRTAWPHPVLDGLAAGLDPASLYHPVVLGACTHAAGGSPADAAAIAATAAVTGPASAAVRLLGLDPLAVQALLARLAPEASRTAGRAAAAAAPPTADAGTRAPGTELAGMDSWAGLPAPAAPGLDLLAELHAQEEVALFES